jgi:hypothetical protein
MVEDLKIKKTHRNLLLFVIVLIVIIIAVAIILFTNNKNEVNNQNKVSKGCEICYSIYGEDNVGSCGGYEEAGFTVCGIRLGDAEEEHYIDTLSLKEISYEEAKTRFGEYMNSTYG